MGTQTEAEVMPAGAAGPGRQLSRPDGIGARAQSPVWLPLAAPAAGEGQFERELHRLRREVLWQAAVEYLGDEYVFVDAAIRELMQCLPKGSRERKLAWRLQSCAQHLTLGAVEVCLTLVPMLQKLLPFASAEELLAALKGGDA